MEAYQHILGHEQLVSRFGYWPSFHDGAVLWFRIDRAPTALGPGPTLEVMVHGFETTDATDARGYLILRNHVLVHFRFAGVFEFTCDSFYRKYDLLELSFSQISSIGSDRLQFQVCFDSVYGSEGIRFKCDRIQVMNLEPCDAAGEAIEAPKAT